MQLNDIFQFLVHNTESWDYCLSNNNFHVLPKKQQEQDQTAEINALFTMETNLVPVS